MMQITATIRKLLDACYCPAQVLSHLAHEVDARAAHLETIGAPRRAAYMRKEAEALREAISKIAQIEY